MIKIQEPFKWFELTWKSNLCACFVLLTCVLRVQNVSWLFFHLTGVELSMMIMVWFMVCAVEDMGTLYSAFIFYVLHCGHGYSEFGMIYELYILRRYYLPCSTCPMFYMFNLGTRHALRLYLSHGKSTFGMIRMFYVWPRNYIGNLCTECPVLCIWDFRRFTWKLLCSVCFMYCTFLKSHRFRITLTCLLTCVQSATYLFSLWSWSSVLFMLYFIWPGYSVFGVGNDLHFWLGNSVFGMTIFLYIFDWVFCFGMRNSLHTFELGSVCSACSMFCNLDVFDSMYIWLELSVFGMFHVL